MAVTAQMVKELREMTGAGMMDCKKALVETDGDMDKSVEVLREKGLSKAAKKAGRVAAMGLVKAAFAEDGRAAAIVEVNSETDFVAKNDEFIAFVEGLAKLALESDAADMDSFMALPFSDGTVAETLTNKIAKIGENMNIRRFIKLNEEGVKYAGYIHNNGQIGVIVGLATDADIADLQACGKDVAMQVASMNPKFLDDTEVDQDWLEEEKKIAREQLLNEGKKEELLDRIIPGKVNALLKEVCLVEQKFVKDADMTVKQYVDSVAAGIGKDITIKTMIRYEVGEGIEKKEEDFAAEVAAQMKK